MSISNNKPIAPPNNPPQTSRPLRSAREITTVPTNWAVQQVESDAPRIQRGRSPGVTSREVKSEKADPARAGSVEAGMRQQTQNVALAADKCLDDAMVALLDEDFEAVSKACKAVTEALAPIVDRRAKKMADASWKAAESLSKVTQSSKKEAEAARELVSFRQKLRIDEEKVPGLAELTADACGDRLCHRLPKLTDDQLSRLNESLDVFLELDKTERESASSAPAPEDLVPHQLLFSVKAELLNRMIRMNKGSSDADTISKFNKDELVDLRDLTTSLNHMVRPGTPSDVMLPGTRFTWSRITNMDTHAESRLDTILKTEGATRRVKNAAKTLKGNDTVQLKRLKGAVDFLTKSGAKLPDVSLPQLEKDVIARIKEIEKSETDRLITPEMRKGPSNTFSAKDLSDAQLVGLMNKLVLVDGLTLELEDVKKDVEATISDRKIDASIKFQKAFRAVLTAKGADQITKALLKSWVVAETSLASFSAVNWDFSEEGLADWMGQEVRAPKQTGQRAGPDPDYVESMISLRDNLTSGEGRVVRDVLAAHKDGGSEPVVAYLDLLNHTLHMLLDGKSAPPGSRAANASELTPAGRDALETTLGLAVKNGRLVQVQSVAHPTAQGAQTPRPQKN